MNSNIAEDKRSVHYCNVHDVGQCLQRVYGQGQAWMAKVDISEAFRLVPISKKDWKFLGICVEKQYFVDRMLPMGAASSCQIFQHVSDALRYMLLKDFQGGVIVYNYLDDFLLVADSQDGCNAALHRFESLCEEIGVPLAHHKTVQATQNIIFLGLGIDARALTLYIPPEKIAKTKSKLVSFLRTKAPKVKHWQSIAGTLNHLSQVVVSARIYISSVYGGIGGILSNAHHLRRRITDEIRGDLNIWLTLLNAPPERPFKVLDPDSSHWPPLLTDASSSIGYGGTWGTKWFVGTWPAGCKANIAILELFPIVVGLVSAKSYIKDTVIRVFTDNNALVHVLNKLYSKDAGIRKLMRPLVALCLENNLFIRAKHIAGADNVGPDLLSRGKMEEFLEKFPAMDRQPIRLCPNLLQRHMEIIK